MSLDHELARLRELMSDAADDVRGADVRDRALATSHRIRLRRAVAGSVLVGVGAVVLVLALAVRPWHRNSLPAVPTPSTLTPSAVPSSVDPSPSTDPSQPTEVYAHPKLGTWSQQPVSSVPGTAYFLTFGPGQSPDLQQAYLAVLANGKVSTASLGDVANTDCVPQSLTVSPNGQLVAWVLGDAGGTAGHLLVITPMFGGGAAVQYPMHIGCSGGTGPRWLPDDSALVVFDHDRGSGTVDVATGTFTPYSGHTGGYGAWSTGGAFHAYRDDNGRDIVVETAAGQEVHRQANDGFTCCAGGFTVQGVSPDGRRVAIGMRNTDPSTVRNALKIIDMTTGREVAVPGPASLGAVRDLEFTSSGGLLVENQVEGHAVTLSRYSASGALLDRITLSPALSDAVLLAYRS